MQVLSCWRRGLRIGAAKNNISMGQRLCGTCEIIGNQLSPNTWDCLSDVITVDRLRVITTRGSVAGSVGAASGADSSRQRNADPAAFRRLRDFVRPRLWFWTACATLLPDFSFPRLRSYFLRAAGCDLDDSIAVIGRVKLVGAGPIAARLHIGRGGVIAPGVTFGLDGEIRIGKNVSISPGVVLYTATHSIGYGSQRMLSHTTSKPIVIEDGVWIGMNSLVLPGVTLGHGSVISAGSVVVGNVPPDTLVAGNPATVRETLPFGNR
jgi:maltose O-acetyltransferase